MVYLGIDLVGRIADRGAEFVSAREWMRICFELLDMLKAHKKGIRRATVNTFGYIAKAIGPQDVLATLLNNLKVQERQNRVCTTVAIGNKLYNVESVVMALTLILVIIAIVAETCAPFTVLPALMNEYRVPELNVQNGVLKVSSHEVVISAKRVLFIIPLKRPCSHCHSCLNILEKWVKTTYMQSHPYLRMP
jgi:splicing factor 3B subunit 1